MTEQYFSEFVKIRADFGQRIKEWTLGLPDLDQALMQLATLSGENNYSIETPIVYNRALDDITRESDIKWIVVADNPGKKEQEAGRQRYLVGTSGMMAERFFMKELSVDFRKETAVINKTPIHSPKTAQLRKLVQIYPEAKPIIEESQLFMASMLLCLQACFDAKVWVMGLSELRPAGLFSAWLAKLKELYKSAEKKYTDELYFFNHFSMGSFSADLARRRKPAESAHEAVLRIGTENRTIIMDRF